MTGTPQKPIPITNVHILCIRVLQRSRTKYNLLSASCRSRKASGIIQLDSKGLRTRGVGGGTPSLRLKAHAPGSYWFKSQCLKAQEPGAPKSKDRKKWTSQLRKREMGLDLPSPFCSVRALDGLGAAHLQCASELHLLPSALGIKCSAPVSQEHVDTSPRNNVLPAIWASLSPVKSTQKISHHIL